MATRMNNKYLINLRGAGASGKTTALKKYCERYGILRVEKVETPFAHLPISILNNGVIVFGDYTIQANCLGADRFKNGSKDIIDCFIAVCEKYNPDIIIYEHMFSSHTFKCSYEISQIAKEFGYEYFAIQLQISEEKRKNNVIKRSGENASLKRFDSNNGKRVDAASKKLIDAGIDVLQINVDNMRFENMWKILEYGIRKKVR